MKTIVALKAVDWGVYGEQVSAKHSFDIVRADIVGFLVSEDEEKIVLTPQWFQDDGTRYTLVIPKCTITSRFDVVVKEIQ